MNNPFLNTWKFRFLYIGIWAIVIVAQISVVFYYSGTLSCQTVYDSLVFNILQAFCILGLWYPVRYFGNTRNIFLFLLFHFILFLISSFLWIGSGYGIIQYFLMPDNAFYTPYFINILPIRIAAGVFVYIIFSLTYYLMMSRNELKIQKRNMEEKSAATASVPIEKLIRIIVKKNSEFHCINVNQIRYIEANGDYVMIYTDSSKYLKDQTMKYWETYLPDDYFVRIHRSFIVNIEVIAKIELYEKEIYKVHLKNGDILKASSAGYKLLKQKMKI